MHPLTKLRLEKGLSQEQLATDLNMYQASICSWEVGRCVPSSLSMYKLANYFKMDINELYKIFPLQKTRPKVNA